MDTGPASPVPTTGRSGKSPDPTAPTIADRLRLLRVSRHLTLHDVEALTAGEFKASALGAYERGDRSLSIRRLTRLAEVYRVDPARLLTAEEEIDLTALETEEHRTSATASAFPFAALARFSAYVRTRRREPSETPITLRASDVEFLGVVLGRDREQLDGVLAQLGLSAPHGRRDTAPVP